MVVNNPSNVCYVGTAAKEGEEPVTLRLAIPSSFERTTFAKEFYGRRFTFTEGNSVTGIPWTPGKRELKFTYVVPNRERQSLWERPLDLPCDHVRVSVQTPMPDGVFCNLNRGKGGKNGTLVFESSGRVLPAGYKIRLELGHLPVPWMAYAALDGVGNLGDFDCRRKCGDTPASWSEKRATRSRSRRRFSRLARIIHGPGFRLRAVRH